MVEHVVVPGMGKDERGSDLSKQIDRFLAGRLVKNDAYVGFFQAVVSGADQRRGGGRFLSANVGDFPRP